MKYTNQIEINLPVDRVVELFDNPENLKQWQPGFVSFEHISGEPGQPGAKSRLKYKMGKRDVEMVETITTRNLPDEFIATYEAKGIYNLVKNSFLQIDSDKTLYLTENEFRFRGFMKLIGALMPGSFKKQTQQYLELFKDFAESNGH